MALTTKHKLDFNDLDHQTIDEIFCNCLIKNTKNVEDDYYQVINTVMTIHGHYEFQNAEVLHRTITFLLEKLQSLDEHKYANIHSDEHLRKTFERIFMFLGKIYRSTCMNEKRFESHYHAATRVASIFE